MEDFLNAIEKAKKEDRISDKTGSNLKLLYLSYLEALKNASDFDEDQFFHLFSFYLERIKEISQHPFPFKPYHQKITSPFDYYSFGLEFMRPLVDSKNSLLLGKEALNRIKQQVELKENAVLFANHQSEVDPQLLSLALEKDYPQLAREIIFVAGDRVLSDPLAVPFSMGRNLLCIYSKRHISHPPELREEKQAHNQKVMRLMRDLFREGGKCIYVAPAGGRDRPNEHQKVSVAPFDPQSIEMFRLISKQSGHPTHFYPLALSTYEILPPPDVVEVDLGELRKVRKGESGFYFGEEIDLVHFPGHDLKDKHQKREALAMHVWKLVQQGYRHLMGE